MYLIGVFGFLIFYHTALADQNRNANHIFNAIHSSMRQWGSSLNHNGMSLFPGIIAAGTQIYHGSPIDRPVEGMEWLAFEPEHASFFAWSLENQTSPIIVIPGLGCMPEPDCLYREKPGNAESQALGEKHFPSQAILEDSHVSSEANLEERKLVKPGWLHTYAAKRDLNILYIDGLAAGKTLSGTLDSQLYLLALHSGFPIDRAIQYDYDRMKYFCQSGSEATNGRIDGFIRMEMGFEVILCDFQDALEPVSIKRANKEVVKADEEADFLGFFFQAVGSRYHGIGASRVILDYDKMVTAFTMDANLFEDGNENPRLTNVPEPMRAQLMDDLWKAMNDAQPRKSINWQEITDMIVTRYSDRLLNLAKATSKKQLDLETTFLWRAFHNYDSTNETADIESCTSQFLPEADDSTAAKAVREVSYKICATLSEILFSSSFEDGIRQVQNLIDYLQWTNWKYCDTCQTDEVCYIAIWPFGTAQDHYHPSCKNGSQILYGTHHISDDPYWYKA